MPSPHSYYRSEKPAGTTEVLLGSTVNLSVHKKPKTDQSTRQGWNDGSLPADTRTSLVFQPTPENATDTASLSNAGDGVKNGSYLKRLVLKLSDLVTKHTDMTLSSAHVPPASSRVSLSDPATFEPANEIRMRWVMMEGESHEFTKGTIMFLLDPLKKPDIMVKARYSTQSLAIKYLWDGALGDVRPAGHMVATESESLLVLEFCSFRPGENDRAKMSCERNPTINKDALSTQLRVWEVKLVHYHVFPKVNGEGDGEKIRTGQAELFHVWVESRDGKDELCAGSSSANNDTFNLKRYVECSVVSRES